MAQSPAGGWFAPRMMLGAVLFNSLATGLGDGTECTLSKLAEDSKLEGVAATPEGLAVIQKDLDRELIGKCQVMPLRRNNPLIGLCRRNNAAVQAGPDQLESSLAEKALGLLVDKKLDVSKQCSLAARKAVSLLC